ncbi:hypothetical protein [Ferribacterium limneticum]|uniref:hypothetical protein n=1 Tax=Ferribacterium limneticum TaxID=76259 RepID=UPI001CFC1603|nr:hypothetical protein [Ferribacterium limneticum]UCV17713.1 hypothetical protein KI610_12885 [Ferribacterium limneticum]
MGKKSRLKQEKRKAQTDRPAVVVEAPMLKQSSQDKRFYEQLGELKGYLTQFGAYDIILALGVSDLWRPNRSSQVKHSLAMLIALSMPLCEFLGRRAIVTYNEFVDFLNGLRRLLPSFPMLEDFVPEADWGEIRVAGLDGFQRIFYGGSVERIPDFIEAFRLLRVEHPVATRDMNLAIALQANILGAIDGSLVGPEEHVAAGHMEVPTDVFWFSCREALLSTYAAIQSNFDGTSRELIVELGALSAPDSLGSFYEAIMLGTALPTLMVQVGEAYLPVAPRAASSVVIDLWHEQANSLRADGIGKLAGRLGKFLSDRLREHDVIAGPADLIGTSHRFDRQIAAVVRSEGKLYFILPINLDDLAKLGQMERWFNRLVDESARWALRLPNQRQIVELRNGKGDFPRSNGIQLVAVIARVSTQAASFGLPDLGMRVIGLPDFVSLFDSVKGSDELDAFITYLDDTESSTRGMIGVIDQFAAFRDSHGVLIEGAESPDWINLDPHWNSCWRFRELEAFWASAPHRFPDDRHTWVVDKREDGLTSMKAKGPFALAWSGGVGRCVVQAFMEVGSNPDYENGPLLELFVHCVADACTQRSSLLEKLELFRREQIAIHCEMDLRTLPLRDDDEATAHCASLPLFTSLKLAFGSSEKAIFAVVVNLSRLYSGLNCAADASFEVECAIELAVGLSALLGLSCEENVLESLRATEKRPPRFTLRSTQRPFDVPDHASPNLPDAGQFKLARKELAFVFKQQGVAPARYELEPAKLIMNSARDTMRSDLHATIAKFDRKQLLQICIAQHDELTAKYQYEVMRLKLSLSHQVSFDRSTRFAEVHEKYTSMARNYRYLLECSVSSPVQSEIRPTVSDIVQQIARIDWLSVLYEASDTLHNGIDVGGIELNDSFVPTVFFSEDRDTKELQYLQDFAGTRLGIGLSEIDEVNSDQDSAKNWAQLDEAFSLDLGFSLTHLSQVLQVLSHWHSAGGDDELRFGYAAPLALIVERVRERLPSIPDGVTEKVIAFLTLDPIGVRRLAGKTEDEPDVPVWEHSKRVHRYTIRPLIQIDQNVLAWGAATIDRSRSIWVGSIVNGYLPADFQWPTVAKVVRNIKEGIEKLLEVRAHEIFRRHGEFVLHGIDFRRRFPKERFDDVGDFDVLAYWPDRNLWVAVECKYNQPPFCLKDARRLRERIFGRGEDHGQFSKIERRRHFLAKNVHRLRELLQWPESQNEGDTEFRDVYVCREISWWLKHPPYETRTDFVRVDALDDWLGAMLKISTDNLKSAAKCGQV